MIKSLNIEHYALIDQLSIDFHSGFSVITGETGAGNHSWCYRFASWSTCRF